MLTPRPQACSLHDYEIVHFCCLEQSLGGPQSQQRDQTHTAHNPQLGYLALCFKTYKTSTEFKDHLFPKCLLWLRVDTALL